MAKGDTTLKKKTKDIGIAHGSNRPSPIIHAPVDCVVLKVLVKDGMEVEKGQPMFLLEPLNISHILPMHTMPEWKKAREKKRMDMNSLRIANIPMEDVLLNHNASAENSPMAALDRVDVLKRYETFKKFDTLVDHSDHLFSALSHAMERPRKLWVDRIHEEWRVLEEHLPDTIYVRVYESRLDLLKAVIVGPEGTPYHNGLFFFDVCLPSDYPISPPVVRYHFTGLGISPNLTSSCGIVRLSLPKTNGDLEHVWVPGTSTILQLLVSIQDLIFNSHPFFNGHKTVRMRGLVDGERCSLLYNENTIRKSLKTMVYTMKNPPKNFEDLVVGHFHKRVRDKFLACKAHINGQQVGCLVSTSSKYEWSSSLEFRNDVASCIKPLVNAFYKIGAKEAHEFLYLSAKKTPVPAYEPPADDISSGSDHHRIPPYTLTAYTACHVDKVLVNEGEKVKDGEPLYSRRGMSLEELETAISSIAMKPESTIKKILEGNRSSGAGIFSMDDVFVDQGDAVKYSPKSMLYNHDDDDDDDDVDDDDDTEDNSTVKMYQKFQKFGFAVDHSDHFFSGEDSAMNKPPTKDWTDRICAERTLLKQCLPQTEIFVRVYKDRLDLLRALIIGPDGTPYHNGLFIFDVCFPSTYPSRPPLVHYRSGGLSINPNMNKFGEVRLSLPKTTGGQEDMWVPSTSTMFHLLLSIQNKIFNKEPLFNDITYACMRGSLCGDQSSLLYKESVFIKSLKTMVNTMNKPPKNFENFVVRYYRDHVRDILMACKKETDSVTIKNDLDSCTTLLVAAFKKIAAVKELEEFFCC